MQQRTTTAYAGQQRDALRDRFLNVRQLSGQIAAELEPEDCVIQSMPDVSPTRWHLAHTTWFFETFLLTEYCDDYAPVNPAFEVLFNSYYNAVGEQFPRARRGVLSRPTVNEVLDYRDEVDQRVIKLLLNIDEAKLPRASTILDLGLQHEQQHQELMLTDIKHVFSCNPLYPAFHSTPADETGSHAGGDEWLEFEEGVYEIGHQGAGFAFDNESPRHRVFLEPFTLASRCVTNGQFLEFIEDEGYQRAPLWLSMGWDAVARQGWQHPLYWRLKDGRWYQFTLHGLKPLRLDEPVCHVSYFEADAFARWHGSRLPTEAEWEVAAEDLAVDGNFVESNRLHPRSAAGKGLQQMFGDVWQWTSSSYAPYPGYAPPAGALGEYNGKFMCNQYVLRGGSCVSSRTHLRSTYRNFFPPEARWQFTGVRLAR